jgi:hypothetical protein
MRRWLQATPRAARAGGGGGEEGGQGDHYEELEGEPRERAARHLLAAPAGGRVWIACALRDAAATAAAVTVRVRKGDIPSLFR